MNRSPSYPTQVNRTIQGKGSIHGYTSEGSVTFQTQTAIVEDIILDDSHPEFKSYADIGKAKVRMTSGAGYMNRDVIPWAVPMGTHIKSYPVPGEIVILVEYFGVLYYDSREILNLTGGFTNHGISTKYVQISGQPYKEKKISTHDYRSAEAGIATNSSDKDGLDSPFVENTKVRPSLLKIGDYVLEGRFGNSIKFGSSESGNPNIIISCGQAETTELKFNEPILESVNEDPSSIYMTSDEEVDLSPATIDLPTHLASAPNETGEYKAQIVINSDKVSLNARNENVRIFSKKSTNISAGRFFTVDANENVVISTPKSYLISYKDATHAGDVIHFDVGNVYIGPSASEPLLLGNTWLQLMQQLIDAILATTVLTGTGPSAPVSASPIAPTFIQLKTIMQQALSRYNYTR